jgi:hypothetical protein
MGGEQRKTKRTFLRHVGMIYGTDGVRIAPCVLRNVSAGGAQLELKQETALPRIFVLALSEKGEVRRRCQIVWQFATMVGVSFIRP